MTDTTATELQALRARVADLEARAQAPAAVVKGFEGLQELSNAITENRLDFFLFERGTPRAWRIFVFSIVALGFIAMGSWIFSSGHF